MDARLLVGGVPERVPRLRARVSEITCLNLRAAPSRLMN